MPFIIQRVEDGAFVAPSGSRSSYVRDAVHARWFETFSAAERDKCGNERILYYNPATIGQPEHYRLAQGDR